MIPITPKGFDAGDIARQAVEEGKLRLTFGQKIGYYYPGVMIAAIGLMFLFLYFDLKYGAGNGEIVLLIIWGCLTVLGITILRKRADALLFTKVDTTLTPEQIRKIVYEMVSDSSLEEFSDSDNAFILQTSMGGSSCGEVVCIVCNNGSVYLSSIYKPGVLKLNFGYTNKRNIRLIIDSVREEEEALKIAEIHRRSLEELRSASGGSEEAGGGSSTITMPRPEGNKPPESGEKRGLGYGWSEDP